MVKVLVVEVVMVYVDPSMAVVVVKGHNEVVVYVVYTSVVVVGVIVVLMMGPWAETRPPKASRKTGMLLSMLTGTRWLRLMIYFNLVETMTMVSEGVVLTC